MLPLLNIRIKFILRHPCLLFFSYIFLPAIIIIVSIFLLIDKKGAKKIDKKIILQYLTMILTLPLMNIILMNIIKI